MLHPLLISVQGLGTDEDTLIEILASRTNRELRDIKLAYKEGGCSCAVSMYHKLAVVIAGSNQTIHETCLGVLNCFLWSCGTINHFYLVATEYKKELEDDIKSDTGGDFRKALLALCKVGGFVRENK